MKVITAAPVGTRIEMKAARRTLDQNAKMWAALSEIAVQKKHCGREVQFIPSLDGSTFIPWGQSSSDLTKAEMSDLLEFIVSWCAQNGVKLHDRQEQAA
jgi:hypothetical protein